MCRRCDDAVTESVTDPAPFAGTTWGRAATRRRARSARTAPRRRASPPCGARSRRRRGRGPPTRPGRPAPPPAPAAPPPAASISRSSRCASRIAFLERAGLPLPFAVARRWPAPARLRRLVGRGARGRGRLLQRSALLAHAQVVGPAALVAVQRAVLDRDRARADRVEQRAIVRDEQHRAGEAFERLLERLAALDVEVVRRLVEDQHVRARVHEDRERQPLALAAGQARRSASPPPRRRRGTGRAARAPCSA